MPSRIKVIPFPEIENAYIVISGRPRTESNLVEPIMSFFYVEDDVGVEWEPRNGPITIIYKCDKDHPEAQPHWYFDYYTGPGHWSQLAVNEEMLGEKFCRGQYELIFNTLKRWRQ